MERIGIYGGTFNPPHIGHIQAAQQALASLKLDRIVLIPDRIAPHKEIPSGSPTPQQRMDMLHLAVNCLSVWFVFRRWSVREMVAAYVIATAAFFCSPAASIGFSNIIFATIGLRTPPFSSSWWRHPNTMTFFAVTLVMFLLPNVSALTHVVSLGLGVVVAMAGRTIRQTVNDSRRYTENM